MAALFWRPPARSGSGWLDGVSGRTTASLVTAGFRDQHAGQDMLLRKAEVQYVLPKCRSTIAR
jgi:hypothetical protein